MFSRITSQRASAVISLPFRFVFAGLTPLPGPVPVPVPVTAPAPVPAHGARIRFGALHKGWSLGSGFDVAQLSAALPMVPAFSAAARSSGTVISARVQL